MIFKFTKPMKDKLAALEQEAFEKTMDIDYETMTLVPFRGYAKVWDSGDRTPEDYEGGKDEPHEVK